MSKLFDLCGDGMVTYQKCHTTEECGMSSYRNSVEAGEKKHLHVKVEEPLK